MQAVQLSLSQEQGSHAETTQQLEGYREMLAATDTDKRQLDAQLTDLQTQLTNSQAALQALQDKVTASEANLAEAGHEVEHLQHQVTLALLMPWQIGIMYRMHPGKLACYVEGIMYTLQCTALIRLPWQCNR